MRRSWLAGRLRRRSGTRKGDMRVHASVAILLAAWSHLPAEGSRESGQPPPPPVVAPIPPILRDYTPVNAERLKHPADGDWLMVRRTYDGWGSSPLDKISPATTGRPPPIRSLPTRGTD